MISEKCTKNEQHDEKECSCHIKQLEERVATLEQLCESMESKLSTAFLMLKDNTDSFFSENHCTRAEDGSYGNCKPFDNFESNTKSKTGAVSNAKYFYPSSSYSGKYALFHIEGLPRTRISNLKKFLTEITNVEREHIANIGYVSAEIVEAVVDRQSINKFIHSFKKHSEFTILPGTAIVTADKAGVLKRLKRVLSEKVKNANLKEFYTYLESMLDEGHCCTEAEIFDVTADAFLKTV